MTDSASDHYDFVIVGGGPAGLTAAMTAASEGFRALVLEKERTPGHRPRGEGIAYYPLFDQVLGEDFIEGCYQMDGSAVYHSPQDRSQTLLKGRRSLYFFEWHEFIERLAQRAGDHGGVTILTDAPAVSVVEDASGACVGVEYRNSGGRGGTKTAFGSVVLGCDGHQSVVGRHFGVPYQRLNCLMVKCRARKANVNVAKTPQLQFYLIGNGDLEYQPDFPPCVAYGFPLGGGEMELGLMLRMGHAHDMQTVTPPSQEVFWKVWQRLKQEYPGFREYFEGAQLVHEEVTALPNAAPVDECVPAPGAVLIGDSAAFVDPFGSSGIYFSMAMARFWTKMLSREMAALPSHRQAGRLDPVLWSDANVNAWNKRFDGWGVRQHILSSYRKVGLLEWYVFKRRRTCARINNRWKLISTLLKLG